MIVGEGASAINERFYDEFWQSCPDFSRYNPGVLHRRRVILELLRMTSHAAPHGILDVGCGNGELLMWLRSVFGDDTRLNGADLSRETIEENKKRHPFATFYDLNVETSSLDDSFAVVLCTEVIEHLDDRRHAIENLAKMVAPGGHLILTCPTGKLHSTERHFGHVSHPTPKELRSQLTAAGLEVRELRVWGFPLYTATKYATNLRPEWALKTFATARYGRREKLVSKALYYLNYLNLRSAPLGCQLFALAKQP